MHRGASAAKKIRPPTMEKGMRSKNNNNPISSDIISKMSMLM